MSYLGALITGITMNTMTNSYITQDINKFRFPWQVSMWVQLQIPKIEDGNNFGVAVQEKVFELLTNTRTKIEAFQTQISK